jgi:hypothetical protein
MKIINAQIKKYYLDMVEKYGVGLQFVASEYQTDEVCKAAVKQNGGNLKYVPEELQTEAMYKEAVSQNGDNIIFVPVEERTDEVYIEAIQKGGLGLWEIAPARRTALMCFVAVCQNKKNLQFVPEDLQAALKQMLEDGYE